MRKLTKEALKVYKYSKWDTMYPKERKVAWRNGKLFIFFMEGEVMTDWAVVAG